MLKNVWEKKDLWPCEIVNVQNVCRIEMFFLSSVSGVSTCFKVKPHVAIMSRLSQSLETSLKIHSFHFLNQDYTHNLSRGDIFVAKNKWELVNEAKAVAKICRLVKMKSAWIEQDLKMLILNEHKVLQKACQRNRSVLCSCQISSKIEYICKIWNLLWLKLKTSRIVF